MENILSQETTKEVDAVERLVCKPLGEMKKTKNLSKDDLRLLSMLHMIEVEKHPGAEEHVNELYGKLASASMPMKILEKRTNIANVKLSKSVTIMMSCLMSTPGQAVLYSCYFMKWCKDNDKREVTLEDWSTQIFPYGTFEDKDLETVWLGQKVDKGTKGFPSDNLVDYFPAAFISLLPKETVNEES